MINYDLVIVGGGLAGASLLLSLKHSGLKIALIEAKENNELQQPALDQRSLVLSLSSKLYFEKIGIWQDIVTSATPINTIKISEQGTFNKLFLASNSLGVEALGYVINIQLLNKVIWDNLSADNGIDIYRPCKLLNIENINSSNPLNLVIDSYSKKQRISCSMLVAADGGRSPIREMAKISYISHDYKQSALIVNVEHEHKSNNTAYERFSAQGPFAILPRYQDNISGIVWPWPADKIDYVKSLSNDELIKELHDFFGYKLGRFLDLGKRQFFPLWQIKSEELFKQRIILIGNSANHIHPVGGQGFNLGLRDVKYFSDCLLERQDSLKQQDYAINSIQQLYKDYQTKRVDDHYNLLTGTDALLGLFKHNQIAIKLLRNISMTMVNHSFVLRSLIADHSMGLRTA